MEANLKGKVNHAREGAIERNGRIIPVEECHVRRHWDWMRLGLFKEKRKVRKGKSLRGRVGTVAQELKQ